MQEFLWIVNDLPAFCAVCYDAEVFTEEECYMANPSLDAWVQERPDFCAEVRFYEEAEGGMSEAPIPTNPGFFICAFWMLLESLYRVASRCRVRVRRIFVSRTIRCAARCIGLSWNRERSFS